MTLEAQFKSQLAKITELNDNIYPLAVEESVKPPYIAYIMSGGKREKNLQGYAEEREINCEINILSKTYSGLRVLEGKVANTLINLVGLEADGRKIQDVELEEPYEMYEEQIKLHRANIIFKVFY